MADRYLSLHDRGAAVRELHVSLGRLGLAIPRHEFDEQIFGVGTQDALFQLQARYELERTGVLDDATQDSLYDAVAEAEAGQRRVEGRIFLDRGLPAANITVRLYNQGFGAAAVQLVEGQTDEQGYYALLYNLDSRAANIELRAVEPDGQEVSLSSTKYNADKFTVLNLVAPARVKPLAAEYQRLTTDLAAQLGDGERLADAQENAGSRRDLTLLHRATGWDARLIALAAMAERLSADTGMAPDALYALFRAGLPTNTRQLARVSMGTVEEAFARANEAGIVNLNDQQIGEAGRAFAGFARTTRRAEKAPGALSGFGELLDKSGLSEGDREMFEEVYFAHRGPTGDLWRTAREQGMAPSSIKRLRVQGKLAFLTFNNAALAASLQQQLGQAGILSRLVEMDLYQSESWKTRLNDLAASSGQALETLIPPAYRGELPEDRLDAYAEDMARKVRRSFPTRVIGRMIGKDELRLGDQHDALRKPVSDFLKNAESAGFELGRVPLGAFIKNHSDTLFQGIPTADVETTTRAVKQLQRLYQITPTDRALQGLYDLGLSSADSAHEVAAFSRADFIKHFGDKFDPDPIEGLKIAGMIHAKAQQVVTTVYSFYTTAKLMETTPPVYATSGPPAVLENAKNELIKHFPSMESLFGSLDFCECEHCHSVLSPAAYLVDLLQFLNPGKLNWKDILTQWKTEHENAPYPFANMAEWEDWKAWQVDHPDVQPELNKKPFELLMKRRPDLEHLPLTCENTHTALPYIDIVNEILEYYVAHDQLDGKATHDTGEATTPELLAEPQNIIPAAYDALINARYPLTLPFDLWLETVRRFCEHFDTPLWQVLETFRPTDELFAPSARTVSYDRAAIFAEYLGISPAEYILYTGHVRRLQWFELYGFDPPKGADAAEIQATEDQALAALRSAKGLSRRLGVSYKELVEIVKTSFVNPELDRLAIVWKLRLEVSDVVRYLKQKDNPRYAAENKAFEDRCEALLLETSSALDLDSILKKLGELEASFQKALVLRDTTGLCDFDQTFLQYADPEDPAHPEPDSLVFRKINLFVRLWKKLGWTIEETDRALQAFLPQNSLPLTAANLGEALRTALIYLAHLQSLSGLVKAGKNGRLKLLTLWSNLPTTGKKPLYAELFLTRSVLKNDAVFDDPSGNYLTPEGMEQLAATMTFKAIQTDVPSADQLDPADFAQGLLEVSYDELLQTQTLTYQGVLLDTEMELLLAANPDSTLLADLLDAVQRQGEEFFLVKGHLLAVQAALNLTADEVGHILKDDNKDLGTAELSLANLSLLYRYGLLAKALKLSVSELIAIKVLSGLNPFEPVAADPVATLADDHPFTHTLRFVEVVEKVKDSGFSVEDLEYLLRHRLNPVGKYRPDATVLLALVKMLAMGIHTIHGEQAIPADPGAISDDVLRQELARLLPAELVENFLGVLTGTREYEAIQENVQPSEKLDPRVLGGVPGIRVSYDDVLLSQHLFHRGMLLDAKKAQLTAANPASALLANLLDAVQKKAAEDFAVQLEAVVNLLVGTFEFEAIEKDVEPGDKLDPQAFATEPALRVSYDEPSKTQRLGYRGLLLDAVKDQLTAANPSPVLATLLDAVQNQAASFFRDLLSASLGMLISPFEFEANGTGIPPAEKLDPRAFVREPAVRVGYDEGGETQRLVCRGRLTAKRRAKLETDNPSPVLSSLLDTVQNFADDQIQQLRVGLLAESDFDALFSDPDGLLGIIENSRAKMATTILPVVHRKLIRQLVVQTLATGLIADPVLVEALLTEANLLTDPSLPGRPLLAAFADSGEPGVSVSFFTSPDGTGNPIRMRTKTADTTDQPAGTNSARLEGYFELPTTGTYRFFLAFKKEGAEAELRLGHLTDPLLQGNAASAEISQFIDLQAGIPYSFTLDARHLDGGNITLLVQGDNLPKGSLSRLTLYPLETVERIGRAHVLLAKTLQLIQGLGLSEREVRHLLTHKVDFDNLDLSKLPTREADDSPSGAIALFGQFLRLAGYAGLKRELSDGTDDLIAILEHARRALPPVSDQAQAKADLFQELSRLIADLTRRDLEIVQSSLRQLEYTPAVAGLEVVVPDLVHEKGLQRLWEALQVVATLGVPLAAIAGWTKIVDTAATQEERFGIARDVKNTIKARYEPENWQRIARPIFDKLRQRQRDALVADIIHRNGFERVEELFEYFLIDPGMEPVVQTSRIRLAISSVQLFIQRCLLNLELWVHPSVINTKQWKWMKRYRVWEANRKIFLFPENWLEPEFRDDKTHLFKEFESALLQGDISNDLAEDAFFNYLKKLEELARLDIVTMYCEENPVANSNTLHVIGRTFNPPHKYFYRRFAHQMWTPWEPVNVEIEGDHVVAVIWCEQLHLFWLTFMEKPITPDEDIEVKDPVTINIPLFKTVEIQLNWCEYFEGQWTTRESSGFSKPIVATIPITFHPSESVYIRVSKEDSESGGEEAAIIHINSRYEFGGMDSNNSIPSNPFIFEIDRAFHLISKNSQPHINVYGETPQSPPYLFDPYPYIRATQFINKGPLKVLYIEEFETKPDSIEPSLNPGSIPNILQQGNDHSLLFCANPLKLPPPVIANLISPFFYQDLDDDHTFFVQPSLTETVTKQYDNYGVANGNSSDDLMADEIWAEVAKWTSQSDPSWTDPSIDASATYQIQTQNDWLTNATALVQFDGVLIGQDGGPDPSLANAASFV